MEITAAKNGIRDVLEKKCFRGILDEAAKIIGTTQITTK